MTMLSLVKEDRREQEEEDEGRGGGGGGGRGGGQVRNGDAGNKKRVTLT